MSASKKSQETPALIMPALLSELQKAEQIILAMLNVMTAAQKSKVHARLDAAGVSGEGMTRHHERHAVIEAVGAVLAGPAIVHNQATPRDVAPAPRGTEIPLLANYRALNDRQQSNMMLAMASAAKKFPRHITPAFRLIVGGAP